MKTLSLEILKQSAISLLAQRDYSRESLDKKLQMLSKDYKLVQTVLDELEQERLLKNDRFAESFVRQHISRGKGPVRIKQELEQKGISAEVIRDALKMEAVDWQALAESTRYKKFGKAYPLNPKEKHKQIRFLQYRGFPVDIVMKLFS